MEQNQWPFLGHQVQHLDAYCLDLILLDLNVPKKDSRDAWRKSRRMRRSRAFLSLSKTAIISSKQT
jgi:DNA-binding response OmpR family regulator